MTSTPGPPLRRPARTVVRWGFAVLGGLGLIVLLVPQLWVQRHRDLYDVAGVPSAPVMLVLGAGLDASGNPTPFLTDRLDLSRQLFEAGKAQVVLVSGANPAPTYNEPAAMKAWLVARGVPADRIVEDRAGDDTYSSCDRTKRIFGIDEAIVVSQSYHVPRALALCRALGVQGYGVGDDRGRDYAAATWYAGETREIAANVKAALEVLPRRDAAPGPPDPAVRDALATVGPASPSRSASSPGSAR